MTFELFFIFFFMCLLIFMDYNTVYNKSVINQGNQSSCDLQVRHNVKVPIVHLWSKFGHNWSEPVRTGAIWKRLTETWTDERIIWPQMTFDLVMWPPSAS